MKCFKLTLAIALGAFLLATMSAEATWYSRQTGNWDDVNTWSTIAPGGAVAANVPQVDGDVQVCNGHTVTVRTTTNSVDIVTVNNGGILNMESTNTPTIGILIVQESITVQSTGTFYFNERTDAQPIVRAADLLCELDGTFTMTETQGGLFDDATGSFEVADGDTVTFVGAYEATISAPIEVDGIFKVDGALVTITGDIAAGSAGWFWVNSGTMTLADAVNIIAGAHFYVTGGAMVFDEDVVTNGGFKQTGGAVTANTGDSFQATGAFVAL